MTKINLGNFKVDNLSQDETIIEIERSLLKSVVPQILVTPNAGHLKSINAEKEISEIYTSADLSLIDGWPIAVAAKNASGKKVQRVTGSDLLPKLFSELNKDIRIGIIGGTNGMKFREVLEAR